jgi:hypothetical protein
VLCFRSTTVAACMHVNVCNKTVAKCASALRSFHKNKIEKQIGRNRRGARAMRDTVALLLLNPYVNGRNRTTLLHRSAKKWLAD